MVGKEFPTVASEIVCRRFTAPSWAKLVHTGAADLGQRITEVRCIQLTGATMSVNRELEAKTRARAGWKGYTTNLASGHPGVRHRRLPRPSGGMLRRRGSLRTLHIGAKVSGIGISRIERGVPGTAGLAVDCRRPGSRNAGGVHRTWQPDERVEVNRYTSAWKAFGQAVQRPRVILVISAHWYLVCRMPSRSISRGFAIASPNHAVSGERPVVRKFSARSSTDTSRFFAPGRMDYAVGISSSLTIPQLPGAAAARI